MVIGPFIPRRKLTDAQKAEIRRIFKTRPRTVAEYKLVAALYRVSHHTIAKISYGW